MEHLVSASAANCIAADVTRTVLPNGLTVLIKENHSAPVVALYALVKVGYFHEPDRLNGIAHVIEHMLFKGTPRRPENEQIAREVRDVGGMINAGTYYEETSYYIVVPSAHLELALDVQADILQNSLIDGGELAKEIEVIVQESLQKRDSPTAMLVESLHTLAHDKHRLRRWRIGHPETLRAFTRDDLTRFIGETYRPENITLAIVGDIGTARAQELVRVFWGDMPRGDFQREASPVEPFREGFRYARMTGDTRQRLWMLSLPAPALMHPDTPPLMVLSALLSDGRSARLYRRLKEELQIANSAWASYEGFVEMGLYTLGAECVGDDPLPVVQALWSEVDRIRHEPVQIEELERIKARVESRRLYAQEEVLGVARTLATYEALGDYRLTDTFLESLHAVNAEDVRRVANTYLRLERASLLEYLPAGTDAPQRLAETVEAALRESEREPASAPDVHLLPADLRAPIGLPEMETPAAPTIHIAAARTEVQEIALPGGGKLLFKPRRDLPIVAISALFRGGRRNETRASSGLTNLMLKSSMKGTPSYAAEEIANRIEGLGSGIGLSLALDYFGYGMKIKKDFLAEGFALFSEVLTHPTFPAEEVEREKQSIYAEIRRQQDSNFSVAYDLFTTAYFGEEHPYGLPASGLAEAISPRTPADLAAWHAQHVTASEMVVAIVGDLEAEEAVALLEGAGSRHSGRGEEPGTDNAPRPPTPYTLHPTPYFERVAYRQKQQTASAMGFVGATIREDDRHALDVLNAITSGMGGRFFRAVRGDNALAYQVTSFHRSRLDAGNFVTYTATSPENEQRARDILLQEIEQLRHEPVSDSELAAAKASIVGEYVIGMQSFGAQAGELAVVGVYGLPLDEPMRYLNYIQSITAEEVRAVAEKYLTTDRYWLGIVRGGASE